MLVRFHICTTTSEADTFGFQAKTLLQGRVAAQLDFAAGAEHALPGQAIGSAQNLCDLASVSGKARSPGDRAVSRDLPARNLQNGGTNPGLRRKLLTRGQVYAAAPLRNDCTASSSLL